MRAIASCKRNVILGTTDAIISSRHLLTLVRQWLPIARPLFPNHPPVLYYFPLDSETRKMIFNAHVYLRLCLAKNRRTPGQRRDVHLLQLQCYLGPEKMAE